MIGMDVSMELGVTSGWKTPVNLSFPNKINTSVILNSDILQKLLCHYRQEHPNTKHHSRISQLIFSSFNLKWNKTAHLTV
jgi:hypothetical protein